MEQYLLQNFVAFFIGLAVGVIIMVLLNKLRGGSVTPGKDKKEYQEYQEQVEAHFEATSKKFKDMTDQYQDLYKHLSVGATSLCRPDSVAAGLADESSPVVKLEQKAESEAAVEPQLEAKEPQKEQPETSSEAGAGADIKSKAEAVPEKAEPKVDSKPKTSEPEKPQEAKTEDADSAKA